MSNRFRVATPLDVDGWEITEALENYALFDEFAERLDTAIDLLHEGQALWRDHLKDGQWSSEATQTVAEVRRLAYNIRQRFDGASSDLATCIRWAVSAGSTVTDSQCVAALAMDRACWAIEALAAWLEGIDQRLAGCVNGVGALTPASEGLRTALVQSVRDNQTVLEMETRERVADLLGEARHYMTIAQVYASPLISATDKARVSAAASKAGRSSAAVRQAGNSERNRRICAAGWRMLKNGVPKGDVTGKIANSAAAEKEPGGAKLSKKMIGIILRAGGVPI